MGFQDVGAHNSVQRKLRPIIVRSSPSLTQSPSCLVDALLQRFLEQQPLIILACTLELGIHSYLLLELGHLGAQRLLI